MAIVRQDISGIPLPEFDLLTDYNGQLSFDNEENEGNVERAFNNLKDWDAISSWIDVSFMTATTCLFCQTPLEIATSDLVAMVTSEEDATRSSKVWSCPWCGYWQMYWYQLTPTDPMGGIYPEYMHQYVISKEKTYEDDLPEGVDCELAQTLRRHDKLWHSMSPTRFEKLLVSVFKANFSVCEIFHVGKSYDDGIDAYFIDAKGQKWLVQAKRREKPNSTEGVSTIRNFLGAVFLDQSLHGIVASTADHFSYRANLAAKKATKLGMEIQLYDKGKLKRMLNPFLPDRPWFEIVRPFDPESAYILSDQIPARAQGRLPLWE
jgi:hypothetical protein